MLELFCIFAVGNKFDILDMLFCILLVDNIVSVVLNMLSC